MIQAAQCLNYLFYLIVCQLTSQTTTSIWVKVSSQFLSLPDSQLWTWVSNCSVFAQHCRSGLPDPGCLRCCQPFCWAILKPGNNSPPCWCRVAVTHQVWPNQLPWTQCSKFSFPPHCVNRTSQMETSSTRPRDLRWASATHNRWAGAYLGSDQPPQTHTHSDWLMLAVFQVVKPLATICSSPSSSSSPSSPSSHVAAATHHPPNTHTQSRSGSIQMHTHRHECSIHLLLSSLFFYWFFFLSVAMAVSATSPSSWFVSELGETLSIAPPPYSYDPNGNDLPRGQRSDIVPGWVLCGSGH